MHTLDGQAGLGRGAWPVDLAIVLVANPVEGDPYRGRPQPSCGHQQLLPVLAGRQRHPGGCERLELGLAAMADEQPQNRCRLGMGGDLVHREGAEPKAVPITEAVGPLQHPGDVVDRHGPIGGALRPAMPTYRRAARHLDVQQEIGDHRVSSIRRAFPGCQVIKPRWASSRRVSPIRASSTVQRDMHQRTPSRSACRWASGS